jgi:hypothetical protein
LGSALIAAKHSQMQKTQSAGKSALHVTNAHRRHHQVKEPSRHPAQADEDVTFKMKWA